MTPLFRRTCQALAMLIMLLPGTSLQAQNPGIALHLDRLESMNRSILQISRHLQANAEIPVKVIAIGPAVGALIDGATDPHGGSYSAQWEQVLALGAELLVCSNTLDTMGKTNVDLILGAETVPSGIAELGRLQMEEGYGYIKL